jgi:hypothetical protein
VPLVPLAEEQWFEQDEMKAGRLIDGEDLLREAGSFGNIVRESRDSLGQNSDKQAF